MSHDQLRILMDYGDEVGCINMSAFNALVQDLDLDDEELNGLYEQIEDRGIELTDDCGLPEVEQPSYVNSELAAMTTEIGLPGVIDAASAILGGRVRGRIVVKIG